MYTMTEALSEKETAQMLAYHQCKAGALSGALRIVLHGCLTDLPNTDGAPPTSLLRYLINLSELIDRSIARPECTRSRKFIHDAFGDIGTTFRELEGENQIFFGRAAPKNLNAS